MPWHVSADRDIVKVPGNDLAWMQRIDEFLQAQPGASPFHTSKWNGIVETVFGTQFVYLVALRGSTILGVMPCHLLAYSPFCSICYSPPRMFEVPYGGPVVLPEDSTRVFRRLVEAASQLRIGTKVEIFSAPQNSVWELSSRSRGWRVLELEPGRVDLSPPLGVIWKSSLDSNRRNMIRKARKKGVKVQVGGIALVDTYYALIQQMTHRTGIALHPLEYYRGILEELGPDDQARIYITYHADGALAGGIFVRFGRVCYYWHGATADNAPNLGQGELIQWQVIRWAKDAGCRWYDLLGIERERLPHIARFKLGFAPTTEPFSSILYAPLSARILHRLMWMTRKH